MREVQEVADWYSMLEFIDDSRDPSEETYSESQSDLEQGLLQFFNSFSLSQEPDGNNKDNKRHSW